MNVAVQRNLITGYANKKFLDPSGGYWADGISMFCTNASIYANTIIDATDVGIVLFAGQPFPRPSGSTILSYCDGEPAAGSPTGAYVCPRQESVAWSNTVLNAGNTAFAMFGLQDNIGAD